MKKKEKKSLAGKLIIGGAAALFILYGVFLSTLWVAGTPTQARVTDFRRELGERDETIRNKYTYTYAYEFTASGKQYYGHSKKVQGPVFLKTQGNSFVTVHYLGCCPAINCPTSDFKPWYKVLIYWGVAFILGYFTKRIN
ncbi:hypothetical protein [Mangrovibacterium sp.]|uniref:hypothetical protein n=1 Tax=Mangrovibacterium sp. TaxID=1961364 RepID=UPI003569D738